MTDRVQPGVKIDEAVWKRFRQDIKERNGGVRGHLRSELEAAIQQYIDGGRTPELTRIEDKVDTICTHLEIDSLEGAEPSRSDGTRTHAERQVPDSKPSANAATDKKIAYLAECVLDAEVPNTRELVTIPREKIRDVVKDEYGFRRDTAKRYVGELVSHFGLLEHPSADGILVSEERHAEIVDSKRDSERQQANDRMNELSESGL